MKKTSMTKHRIIHLWTKIVHQMAKPQSWDARILEEDGRDMMNNHFNISFTRILHLKNNFEFGSINRAYQEDWESSMASTFSIDMTIHEQWYCSNVCIRDNS